MIYQVRIHYKHHKSQDRILDDEAFKALQMSDSSWELLRTDEEEAGEMIEEFFNPIDGKTHDRWGTYMNRDSFIYIKLDDANRLLRERGEVVFNQMDKRGWFASPGNDAPIYGPRTVEQGILINRHPYQEKEEYGQSPGIIAGARMTELLKDLSPDEFIKAMAHYYKTANGIEDEDA